MTAEVMDQITDNPPPEAEPLEMFLLTILESNDGLCLDNEPERARLAAALAAALVVAAGEGTINQPVLPAEPVPPDSPPQTTGSSVSTLLPE